MKKTLFSLLLVLISVMSSFGQNTWDSSSTSTETTNGNITTTNGDIIATNGIISAPIITATSISSNPAISGVSPSAWGGLFDGNIGVQGTVICSETFGFAGVYGVNYECENATGVYAENSANNGYALLAYDNGTGASYAGYFQGNLHYSGTLSGPSDKKLKEKEQAITSALGKIAQLKPTTYNYKTVPGIVLPPGRKSGFIAQELQEVFPDLVTKNKAPKVRSKDGKVTDSQLEYLGIDYISLIPYLTAAIQEQQNIIEDLKAQVEKLAKNENLEAEQIKSIRLYQNNPNPFNQVTSIKYSLSGEHKNANIFVYNLNGEQIKKFELISKGEGKIDINGGELNAGMYIYSLIIDGKEVETKKMILTK